jgi:hypothetical protein
LDTTEREENRQGRLSPAQVAMLRSEAFAGLQTACIATVLGTVMAALGYFAAGLWAAALARGDLRAAGAVRAQRTRQGGRPAMIEGRIRYEIHRSRNGEGRSLFVGKIRFHLLKDEKLVTKTSGRARVYYGPRSKTLLAFEHLGD